MNVLSRQKSVYRKLLIVVLSTTAFALLLAGIALAILDLRSYRQGWIAELTTQADVLSLATAPALEFEDPSSAQAYLDLLKAQPAIIGAALYTANGALFATYTDGDHADLAFPRIPELDGFRTARNQLDLFKRIDSGNEILGTVYIKARYDIGARLRDHASVLAAVLLLSFGITLLIARPLQRNVTRPITEITKVARDVIEKRDFSARAPRTTEDEIGVLVDAFNGMLAEISTRTEVLEKSNRDLAHEIGERSRAEDALMASEDRLLALNAELESRVAARTSELEAANKDLEGFSYSVSHDLRAPLRAILGFSALFAEEHQTELGDEGRRKLGIIRRESERMGRLIDDLLAFSRLGRKALQPVSLDMTALVQSVIERLKRDDGACRTEFRIGSLPQSRGDQNLFEQVWLNLIANAVKFSSKRETPVVEIGGIVHEQEHIYYVRDNGAGFESRYSARLFGVFQRLHRQEDFPGTGVGLALVHKIVTRHGGRVWADGKPDAGATFHFALPKEEADG
ncbi:MAG: ATP-binding protein [Steroidobacteraceae bacterium]